MQTRSIATKIVSHIQDAGHIAYFAGGWVRDHLLGLPSDDIDIATSASVEEIQILFPKTIPVGIAFGIVIVVEEGHHFEVATFRKEREYTDGRRPLFIEKASPEEDAGRRDFTINGLFFDPLQDKLLDFVGGVADLKKGTIRAIGDPHHRFLEDRLRMMRAVRYSTRFHFPIEIATEQAILSHAKSLFPSVAIERVWQEFQKMSLFADFNKGLEKLHTLNLLEVIFPRLKGIPLSEIQKRTELFPFDKSCPLILELIHLFPEDSLQEHLELSDYLKLSNQDKDYIKFFHKAKSLLDMPISWQEKTENLEWAHFYSNPLSSLCIRLLKAPEDFHEKKRESLMSFISRILEKRPLLKAEDLQKEGVKPGPSLGILLKEGERLSTNALLEDKNEVIERLKNHPLWPKN